MKFNTASFVALVSAATTAFGAVVELQKRESGEGTWFNLVGYVACGTIHSDSEFVVGVSTARYDATAVDGNPNNNKICRQQISIDGPSANGPVIATIVDRCGKCAYNDIDMSPALYQHVVGDLGSGRRPITWNFVGGGPGNGACQQNHTVASGDTCWALSQRFGVSVAQIQSWNPSVNAGCTNLQVGQQLCVRK